MRARLLCVVLLASCGRDVSITRKWLADWETARACIFASPEYGPDGETAYAVSSMLKQNECAEERIRLIALRDEDRASIPDWDGLRTDLDAVVKGGVVATGIDRIDARVARLRELVRLPAITRARTKRVVQLPAGKRIEGPNVAVTSRVEHDSIVLELPDRLVEIESPDRVRVTEAPASTAVGFPSRAWTAKARGGELTITELEDKRESAVLPLPGDYIASRAMDRGSSRLVVLEARRHGVGFAVAHSHDRGRTWKVERTRDELPLTRSSQDRASGQIEIMVESEGAAYLHQFEHLDPWAFPTRVEIPKFESGFSCRHQDVLWSLNPKSGHELLRVTLPTSRVLPLLDTFHEIEDCRATSSLLIKRGSKQFLLACRGDDCKRVHDAQHSFDSAAAILDDGTWLYAAANGPIVGVWREKAAEPAFYRLAQAGDLVKVRVMKGRVYLVLVIAGSYEFVELPAV